MDTCRYEEVPEDNERNLAERKKLERKFLLRQLLICIGVWCTTFLCGLSIGAPTVFIPQIRKEYNFTNIITDDMASWLSSVYAFSGFCFTIILTGVTKWFGRKITVIVALTDNFAAFLCLYYSNNISHVLISQTMQGLFSSAQLIVACIILTEFTSPKYRGVFLTIKSVKLFWGIWASNAIGTFLHWKVIPLFGMTCALITILIVIMWPESPYWLASRGRFEECATAHRWLKGRDEVSERELEAMIKTQRAVLRERVFSRSKVKALLNGTKEFFSSIKAKEFYKPTLLSLSTACISFLSGKLTCAVYALDIIKKITNNESTAYIGMLILDGVTILSMYTGCVLAKFVSRRSLFLVASSVGVAFLFILSLYLYLIKISVFIEDKYVSICLLAAFSICVSAGPMIMGTAVCGELIPIKSRNLSMLLIGLGLKFVNAFLLKISPIIFRELGLHTFFLISGICSSLVILILYRYLPDTKDKNLHEIADSI